jgi:hypothetical protein
MDDMHKTFRASLVAREAQGPSNRPFDFWQELQLASSQVEATLKNSSLAKSSADMRGRVTAARNTAENQLYNGLNGAFNSMGSLATVLFVQLPQVAVANLIRGVSRAIIAVITVADRAVAPKDNDP